MRKTPIFCRKLAKIAENNAHNIDPRLGVVSQLGRYFLGFGAIFHCLKSHHEWAQFFFKKSPKIL
jgi:hypothetical protein